MSNKEQNITGLLILFHGAKKLSNSTLPQLFLDNIIRQVNCGIAEYGFLSQGFSPNYLLATDRLVEQGVNYINVWPVFLLPGKHLDEDIPKIPQELMNKYPQLSVKLLSAPNIIDDLSDALGKQLKQELFL